jgi:hypothetical protein
LMPIDRPVLLKLQKVGFTQLSALGTFKVPPLEPVTAELSEPEAGEVRALWVGMYLKESLYVRPEHAERLAQTFTGNSRSIMKASEDRQSVHILHLDDQYLRVVVDPQATGPLCYYGLITRRTGESAVLRE